MKDRALALLRQAMIDPQANFRVGQWESIDGLLDNKRMLVVQATGWGKSMIFFLATKLFREKGAGPTLLISPLLSLMRNQLEASHRVGVRTRLINSANKDEWPIIQHELERDEVDLLIVSPERLAKEAFRNELLPIFSEKIGLFVVDEAHCISDWGHDFRPDYKRIARMLNTIPPNVPILATTATANNRVVTDIKSQLGDHMELIRGSLVRESLKLQNINMPSPAARMAWLAQMIPDIKGSGIIYTLTQKHAERLCEWLNINNIDSN